MKKTKKLLVQTAVELVTAKELVREKRKELKKARDPVRKANVKRVLEVVEQAVESIDDHRKLLQEQLSVQESDALPLKA